MKWDRRFIQMATLVASWSKDPSTQCGAVIVRPNNTVASVGYNGFPQQCSDAEYFYENRELKYARIIHAEQNALLFAKESVAGYTMYTCQIPMIGPSCDRCTAHVIQAGITRVVCPVHSTADRWKESIHRGLAMYDEAGVEVVQC